MSKPLGYANLFRLNNILNCKILGEWTDKNLSRVRTTLKHVTTLHEQNIL